MDKVLESSPDFMFATATDVNAYLPTHNTKFQQPLTGDRAKDLGGNRSKRKFETPVGLRAKAISKTGRSPRLASTNLASSLSTLSSKASWRCRSSIA